MFIICEGCLGLVLIVLNTINIFFFFIISAVCSMFPCSRWSVIWNKKFILRLIMPLSREDCWWRISDLDLRHDDVWRLMIVHCHHQKCKQILQTRSQARTNILFHWGFQSYLCVFTISDIFYFFQLVSLVKVKLEINLAGNINEALYHILFWQNYSWYGFELTKERILQCSH